MFCSSMVLTGVMNTATNLPTMNGHQAVMAIVRLIGVHADVVTGSGYIQMGSTEPTYSDDDVAELAALVAVDF